MEYLVTMNIVANKELLNPTNTPILYYSNTNNIDKLSEELRNDETFVYYINNNINIQQYGQAKASYFVFNISSEDYHERIENLQNIYKLDKSSPLTIKYILAIFEYLYRFVDKETKLESDNDIDLILHIYDILKSKYNERVSPKTLREYINSQLKQKYGLSEDNTNTVLEFYDELIV